MILLIALGCGKFDHLEEEGDSDTSRLQIRASCADELCAERSTYGHAQTELGGPGVCEQDFSDVLETNVVRCDWEGGVSIAFDDANGSGVLGETETAMYLSVWAPWDGTNAQGLGVGSLTADFFAVFGDPLLDWDWHAYWSSDSFAIWDLDEDGIVDEITLY